MSAGLAAPLPPPLLSPMPLPLPSSAHTPYSQPRRGVWHPGQKLDEAPASTPSMLLSSSFAQEMYITLPASQLFHAPGSYMLQVWPGALC